MHTCSVCLPPVCSFTSSTCNAAARCLLHGAAAPSDPSCGSVLARPWQVLCMQLHPTTLQLCIGT